ncbi:lipoprotein-releasing system permease protein [Rhodoblastus acidophilus]|uniref:Lipoprotein-releasing system permease protein n=1 Tax=Rhodoblastus acidophilus TaxID=1074 RepID=A0A212RH61_RHOAC|nr:lipoprotein-releasing ABC transporter permease subunit [Rhodoblastus acidophilus]MCW2316962.1 lipoprotein-releasing system permease protein [Rhodoblastus acidophilus]PPQ39577.1 lipoprotein-releasing system transmembrane subunit, LolC/LolE family [Rhodoblastus acidophilus]RAI24360.1 lipoprotein-releasing system transmembrane subunit, LolC/LolE family [Rhodoblastus acidophilus]SNB71650.1 lipoprotein-releasing system permease protein [Rhodoblastus acidophilus]
MIRLLNTLFGRDGAKPFGAYERMLALRYMRARRHRFLPSAIAGLSVTGITVGVMSLIVVMAVMNGMRAELVGKIIGVNGHFFLQPIDTPMTDYKEVAAKLEAVPGVRRAIPMVESPAGISSPTQQTGALVRGVSGEDLKRLPGIEGNIRQGTLEGFDASGGLAIGQRMADNLGVRVGDTVSILTAKGAQTPFGVTPRMKAYPVKAIFQFGLSDFDQLFVYMPLEEAQVFFNKEGEVSVIEGFAADPEKMDDLRMKIEAAIERPNILTDWRQRNKGFFDVLKVESQAIFLILAIIVAVAALLIVQGLILLVKDKTRDIAILRTMGATRWAVLRIFILTGVAIGLIGVTLGVGLGVPLALHLDGVRQFLNRAFSLNLFPAQYYFGLSQLPTVVERHEVIAVAFLTLGLSFVATLYPAWRAARLDPVEALRHE